MSSIYQGEGFLRRVYLVGFGEVAARRVAAVWMAAEKKILAMVLGNQEFGPRALSHIYIYILYIYVDH